MTDSNSDADIAELVSSIVNSALPECDQVSHSVLLSTESQPMTFPRQSEEGVTPWHQGGAAVREEERQNVIERRSREFTQMARGLVSRPQGPNFDTSQSYFPWFSDLRTLRPVTVTVERSTQTLTVAIARFPVESRSFPVPWSRRLRTASAATQTETNTWRHSPPVDRPVVPTWDTLPEEMFFMDDLTPHPLDASLDDAYFSASLDSFSLQGTTHHELSPHVTNFYDDSPASASFHETSVSRIWFLEGLRARWPTTLPQREDDVVIIFSSVGKKRTVATNTLHVGWRRQRPPPTRLRLRKLSLGWLSNPVTTEAATQTDE
ncbi:uncharacterized protein LOC121870360 [Homarus americanus]|uniref:uncharacterized protein LOC121870360 n=1 Tax=Homarus americanus TaxID=6706 RepID=UPI001C47944B|nr:uncharacterized protein LOC121870360 [Homarus americanus]